MTYKDDDGRLRSQAIEEARKVFSKIDSGAKRYDHGKPRWDLLPFDALTEVVVVYTKGAEKYTDRNWELGMSWSRMFRSMLSHAFKWWLGSSRDKELGTYHMAMVVWNALGLLTYEIRKVGTDDRPNLQEHKDYMPYH